MRPHPQVEIFWKKEKLYNRSPWHTLFVILHNHVVKICSYQHYVYACTCQKDTQQLPECTEKEKNVIAWLSHHTVALHHQCYQLVEVRISMFLGPLTDEPRKIVIYELGHFVVVCFFRLSSLYVLLKQHQIKIQPRILGQCRFMIHYWISLSSNHLHSMFAPL